MQLFQPGVNLTPAQRASLKAIQGLIFTALIAALDAAVQYFAHNSDLSTFNWSQFVTLVIGAALASLLYTANKLRTAASDPPLTPAGTDMIAEAGPPPALPVAPAGPLVVIHTAAPPVVSTPFAGVPASNTVTAMQPTGSTYNLTYGAPSAGPAPLIIRGNTPRADPGVPPTVSLDTAPPAEAGPAATMETPTQTPA